MNRLKKFKIIILALIILVLVYFVYSYFLLIKIEITSSPDNIEVYIDNKDYVTPMHIKIRSGKYNIWGVKEGYEIYNQKIEFNRKEKNLNIVLSLSNEKEPKEGAPIKELPTPQISDLPVETDHFIVRWDSAYLKYLIVPNIPFNKFNAPQYFFETYWVDYEKYAKEALLWIKNKGVTPSQANIMFWGQEWWPAGKTINF